MAKHLKSTHEVLRICQCHLVKLTAFVLLIISTVACLDVTVKQQLVCLVVVIWDRVLLTFTLRHLKLWVLAFPMRTNRCVLRRMLVNALRVLISIWIRSVLEQLSIPCWPRLKLMVVRSLKMRRVNLRLLMWQLFLTIWARVYVALVQKLSRLTV